MVGGFPRSWSAARQDSEPHDRLLLGRAAREMLEQIVEVVKTARAEGAEPKAGNRRSLETGGTGQQLFTSVERRFFETPREEPEPA